MKTLPIYVIVICLSVSTSFGTVTQITALPGTQAVEYVKGPPGTVPFTLEADGYNDSKLYALVAVCTHLGCPPNWLEAQNKFKCPCHGSGYYKNGINFEGPAPRPLERAAISLADDGQIEVDKSKTFQEEMGQWSDPSCYIPV